MKRAFQNLIHFLIQYNIPLCLLGLYALGTRLMGCQNCPIKLLIGFPCPGCGMTRAVLSLAHFDFVAAFQYNPFVYAIPLLIICIAFKDAKWVQKILNNKWISFTAIFIVLLVYVLRFIFVYPNVPMDYNQSNLLSLIISIFQ